MTDAQEQVAVTTADVDAASNFWNGGRDPSHLAEAFAKHRLAATRTDQATSDVAMRALKEADDAIREMFRYFDGGETRGSYDGRPERNQLRKAGYATRRALASLNPTPEDKA